MMDCFIKKIFSGKTDEHVHGQFQKFSRGVFKQRALVRATKSAKGYSLNTGSEYANELVRAMASKLGQKKAAISGVIVSTADLKSKLPYTDLKQFMGIKQYVIYGDMSGQELVKLVDELPEAFFALSFSFDDNILKIKAKAPKSAKPKTSEEPPKADFCSLKTTDVNLINHFVFNVPATWKSFQADYTYEINDIEIPVNVKDPNEMRRLAKRKGKIIRNTTIDDQKSVIEANFVA